MQDLKARVYALSIPFKLDFTHSQASRQASDSIVVEISDGKVSGFGEAVAREYVTGTSSGALEEIADTVGGILQALPPGEGGNSDFSKAVFPLTIKELEKFMLSSEWPRSELPLLCAVEGALLDLMCRYNKVDIYTLLQRAPRREEIQYGGTLPILPEPASEKMLLAYKQMDISNLRVKLANETTYNRRVLEKARRILGDEYDLRVDANAAWSVEETLDQLEVLREYGISLVEEPLGLDREEMRRLCAFPQSTDFCFVADESAVTFQDIEKIKRDNTFGMINIRLSKHGGLLRGLRTAELADEYGLKYQLGCHVGETGILSGLGRVAASLMSTPLYADGSYDRHLLAENIITKDYTFGFGGTAAIRRNQGVGYIVDTSKLEKVTSDYCTCS